MEYIYIRIYDYVCSDGTNIEFYDIILYTIMLQYNISSAGDSGLPMVSVWCPPLALQSQSQTSSSSFSFSSEALENWKNARLKSCNVIRT